MDLVWFHESHLQPGAALLAARHERDRRAIPWLSPSYADSDHALEILEAQWRRPGAAGAAALRNGRLVGYLVGHELHDDLLGHTGWVQLEGLALARGEGSSLYGELYTYLADHWARNGIFDHYVVLPSADGPALEAWFSLSFGKQQAYGILPLDRDFPAPEPPQGVLLRRATVADRDQIAGVADTNLRYQMGAPIFACVPAQQVDAVRAAYVEALEDGEHTFWVAEEEGLIVAFHVYGPPEPGMAVPENSIALPAAATLEARRGRGIGRALTRRAMRWAQEAGYGSCVLDWRTTNPLAARFWPAMGCTPAAYRLVRRIHPALV